MKNKFIILIILLILLASLYKILPFKYIANTKTKAAVESQANIVVKEVYPECIASLCPIFSEVDVILENGLPLRSETLIRIPLAMTQGAGKIVILSSDGEKVFDSGVQHYLGFDEAEDGNGFILKYSTPNDQNLNRINYQDRYIWVGEKFVKETTGDSLSSCKEDLKLTEASKRLNDNKIALDIIKSNCLLAEHSFTADLQNIGKKDFVFWGIGAGCVSCHAKFFYVISDNNIIFQKELDDPTIETDIINGKNMLVIAEPIRKQNENYSSPSTELKSWYLWETSLNTFKLFKSQEQKIN